MHLALPMAEKEKRKRGQNFTPEEKDKLLKLIALHRLSILNKKTDSSANEAKLLAWVNVTNRFNSTATLFRSKDSLLKVWEKLKSDSKQYYQNRENPDIGTKYDPVLEKVLSLIDGTTDGHDWDLESDSTTHDEKFEFIGVNNLCVINMAEDIEQNPSINGDTGCIAPRRAISPQSETILPNIEQNAEIDQKPDITQPQFAENVSQPSPNPISIKVQPSPNPIGIMLPTPIAIRPSPLQPQTNGRTKAVSSLCSSYSHLNKKKEDIEDIKRQILNDELVFKRKLYELQLQAAAKEVEIKDIIIKQLKGGTCNMQSLLGTPQKN